MQVTGRLGDRSNGAERCRSLAGSEIGNVELSDVGHWQVVRKVMWS